MAETKANSPNSAGLSTRAARRNVAIWDNCKATFAATIQIPPVISGRINRAFPATSVHRRF